MGMGNDSYDEQVTDSLDVVPAPLMGPADIRELAQSVGIRPTKTLGQNFVIDPNTIRRILTLADIRSQEQTVLEVGPGLGSLTLGLLDVAHRVIAIEIDPTLARQLPKTVAVFRPQKAHALTVVESDAMAVDELPWWPDALVANLPYNVAVPVLLHLLGAFPSIEQALVMVQDEVADRLAAQPGSKVYGVPSVKASWFAQVSKAGVIGTQVFWPAPRIRSGLVRLVRRVEPVAQVGAGSAQGLKGVRGARADRDAVFAVVDAAFAQRRKTLRAALGDWAGSAQGAQDILEKAGIDPAQRGEKLDVCEFAAIAAAGVAHGIYPREGQYRA